MAEFILIRHGQTDWNIAGRYQGQADPALNETGWEQARRLAEALKDTRLDRLYSSPLRRALQTAQVIAADKQIPLQTDARLMEIHQGDWQTRLRAEIESLYPELFKIWESEPWKVTPPGGESLQQVQRRVYLAMDEILAQSTNLVAGIVAHRIPIALLKLRYQGLDPDIVRSLDLPNTYYETISLPPTHRP
jgi:broad specificity phosphatase PhoE